MTTIDKIEKEFEEKFGSDIYIYHPAILNCSDPQPAEEENVANNIKSFLHTSLLTIQKEEREKILGELGTKIKKLDHQKCIERGNPDKNKMGDIEREEIEHEYDGYFDALQDFSKLLSTLTQQTK